MTDDFKVIGGHIDLPVDKYNAIEAVRNSRLKEMARSPLHYWHAQREGKWKQTEAMRFGTMFHTFVLEPKVFAQTYFLLDEAERPNPKYGMTSAENAAWRELKIIEAEQKGGGIYTAHELDQMAKMAKSISQVGIAQLLLDAEGFTEYSMVWDQPIEYFDNYEAQHDFRTVRCKCRIDKFLPDYEGERWIIDIKTTDDADPDIYDKKAWSSGYHRAAAMYSDAVDADHFVLIVVEKEAPYAVAMYRFDDQALEKGRHHEREGYVTLLRKIAKYRKSFGSEFSSDSHQWPGYESKTRYDFHELKAPFWV